MATASCARALGRRAALWGGLALIPGLNIIAILAINQIAFNRLKAAGLHFGLLGVRVPDRPPASFQPVRPVSP